MARFMLGRLLLVVVVGGSLNGCGGAVSFGPGLGSCQVTAENPRESETNPGSIVGMARISCRVEAQQIQLKVVIEHRVGSDWQFYAGNDGDGEVFDPVMVNERYTARASAGCRSGEFRTAARGAGMVDGRSSQPSAWTYSSAVTDPCG